MRLYFNSSNPTKHKENAYLFRDSAHPPLAMRLKIIEILEYDLLQVVLAKAASAYAKARVPLFVEHGGLYIKYFNDLPGALVQPFWERLEGGICGLLPSGADRSAYVVQMVCLCDGRHRKVFRGEVKGRIAKSARGEAGFHWDPIFIPEGEVRTFAEMKMEEKLEISPTAQAVRALRREVKF